MGRHIEGEQALVFASSLGLKDYTVISEIIELYDGEVQGERAQIHLSKLQAIQESACFPSIEPLGAGKPKSSHPEEEQNE